METCQLHTTPAREDVKQLQGMKLEFMNEIFARDLTWIIA